MFKQKRPRKTDRTLENVETLQTQINEMSKILIAQGKQLTTLSEQNTRLKKDLYDLEDDVKELRENAEKKAKCRWLAWFRN